METAILDNLRRKTLGAFDAVLDQHRNQIYLLFTWSALIPELPADIHEIKHFMQSVIATHAGGIINHWEYVVILPSSEDDGSSSSSAYYNIVQLQSLLKWLESWHASMIAYYHATGRDVQIVVALFAYYSRYMLRKMDQLADVAGVLKRKKNESYEDGKV